jgi:hypothetical protein
LYASKLRVGGPELPRSDSAASVPRRGDLGGERRLQVEQVSEFERPRQNLGPEVFVGEGVDELNRETDAVAGHPHAALQDVPCAQRVPGHLPRNAAHEHGRGPRRQPDSADLGQSVEDLLVEPVGQVGLIALDREVGQRQHGQGGQVHRDVCGLHGREGLPRPRSHPHHGDESGSDQRCLEPHPTVGRPLGRRAIRRRRTLDPRLREVERPGQSDGQRETQEAQDDEGVEHAGSEAQGRQDQVRALENGEDDGEVGRADAVDLAALQLGEEVGGWAGRLRRSIGLLGRVWRYFG